MPTREQIATLQRLVDIGQHMCDVLEGLHRSKLAMFDSDGAGPLFVATPEDIREHGPIMAVGGMVVDIEGWHRTLTEVGIDRPELRIPHRPRRPPPSEIDDDRTCTCEGREGPDSPHAQGCPASEGA